MDASILRALQDKVYDKRKHAAFLLEAQVKDHLAKTEYDLVDQIVHQLSHLALNSNPSWRWGGVMGLAACSIALGSEIPNYLVQIVPPIIACFTDPDSKVRYFSCESMYNVAKVAKGEILVYFTDLFDSLSKLAADPDPAVKNGAELLDRLIKDIVTEQAATYVSVIHPQMTSHLSNLPSTSSTSSSVTRPSLQQPSSSHISTSVNRAFSLERFIPLLRERIYNLNPFTRQYLVSWLQLLNSIPELNLISYLPEFLDGLIKYLADSGHEIQIAVQNLLADCLIEIDNVVHANEYKEQRRFQKRELRRQRKLFEKKMETTTAQPALLDQLISPRAPRPDSISTGVKTTIDESDRNKSIFNDDDSGDDDDDNDSDQKQNTGTVRGVNSVDRKFGEHMESNLAGLEITRQSESFDSPDNHQSADDGDSDEDDESCSETSDADSYVPGQGVELDLASIVEILIRWMSINDIAEEIQSICLRWLGELIHIDQSVMIPFTPRLIPIILGCLSHDQHYIKEVAVDANYDLFKAVEQLPTPPPPSLPPLPPPPPPQIATLVEKRDKRLSSYGNTMEKSKGKLSKFGARATPQASPARTPVSWTSRFKKTVITPKQQNVFEVPPPAESTALRTFTAPAHLSSDTREERRDISRESEEPVQETVTDPLDYTLTVNALTLQFLNEHEETRLAALKWLMMLHNKVPNKILTLEDGTFPALLKTLSDESEEVIKFDLELLSQICLRSLMMEGTGEGYYFKHFIWNLLSLFGTDRNLLESRGNLIVRVLCKNLNSERIFKTFAEYLETDEDLEFASSMVQNLNLIMITSPELNEMRKKLKNLETKESIELFKDLYRSFSHNPISTLTLCLLSPIAYEHAFNLLSILANDLEITVTLLIQVDKLVQLLESPVFTSLRLQLLEPDKHPYLYKALYGILMLLPQSSAFATLRNRLGAVSTLGYVHAVPRIAYNSTSSVPVSTTRGMKNVTTRGNGESEMINWNSLLSHFKAVQTKHEKLRRQQHHESVAVEEEEQTKLKNEDNGNKNLNMTHSGGGRSSSSGSHLGHHSQLTHEHISPIKFQNQQNPIPIPSSSSRIESYLPSKIPNSTEHRRKKSIVSSIVNPQTNININNNNINKRNSVGFNTSVPNLNHVGVSGGGTSQSKNDDVGSISGDPSYASLIDHN